MYSVFQISRKFIAYQFLASNGKGHGVHSPFVFNFIKDVLNDRRNYTAYESIEQLRNKLLADRTVVGVKDFGAGSAVVKSNERLVRKIAASSLKPKKFGQLLYRMVAYYQPAAIVELGTSLGITTAYLASAAPGCPVCTIEGSPEIAQLAKRQFDTLRLQNIQLITGNFDDTLAGVLKRCADPRFVFVDGNHRKEPTLRYFSQIVQFADENTIIVFDDIHWSKEMEESWELIKADESVTLTIDLFFIGIVFFKRDFVSKQHFTVRF